MTSIEVLAEKTAEGWVLQTADNAKDTLAGPFATLDESLQTAIDLDLIVKHTLKTPKRQKIKQLAIGTLFRIDDSWYRYIKCDGEKALLDVVGEKSQTSLPVNTEVSQVSVLSLK